MDKAYNPLTGKNEDATSFKNRHRIIKELRSELRDNGYTQRLKHFAARPWILDKMISNLTRVLPPMYVVPKVHKVYRVEEVEEEKKEEKPEAKSRPKLEEFIISR